MLEDGKKTLKGLLLGILLYTIPFVLIGIFIGKERTPYFLGLFLGIIVAMGLALNLYRSIEHCLLLDPESAEKTMKKKAVIRYIIMACAVGISFGFPNIIHPVGMFFGLLGLKVSAYVQPFIHR